MGPRPHQEARFTRPASARRRATARRATIAALILLTLVVVAVAPPAAATAADLGSAKLDLGDLPDGYRSVSADDLDDAALQPDQLADSLADNLEKGTLHNLTICANKAGSEIVMAGVIGPLTSFEAAGMDQVLGDPQELLDSLADVMPTSLAGAGPPRKLDAGKVGDVGFGFEFRLRTDEDVPWLGTALGARGREATTQQVIGRRGAYLLFVGVVHIGADSAEADVVKLARVLDRRLMRAQGLGYRDTGPLVPEISTHIPTPLDMSTDPRVVFTNLLLAALATLAMSVAMRLLNQTLATREGALEKIVRPAGWLRDLWRRLDAQARRRLKGRSLGGTARLAGIVIFYGVVFSLLEPDWDPFSLTGLYLLFCMTVAFGVVGIAGDIAEWRAAQRLGLPADFKARPGLVVIALGSVAATRLFGIVPGIMIGTPDAFRVDEGTVEERRARRLAKVGLGTMAAVAIGVWLATIATDLVQRSDLPDLAATLVAGLEALLLIVFAVAAENLFAELLGFRESNGELLRRANQPVWVVALLASTALFLAALLNPEGDLADALSSTNVVFFLVTVAVFVLCSVGIWLYFRRAPLKEVAVVPANAPVTAAETVAETVAASVTPATAPAATMVTAMAVASSTVPAVPGPWAPAAGMKTCPACGQTIRAAARLCRFCRTRFELHHGGYCGSCRTMVATDAAFVCTTCGGAVLDRQVQTVVPQGSGWGAYAGYAAGAAATAAPPTQAGWAPQRRARPPLSRARKAVIAVTVILGVTAVIVVLAMQIGS